MTTIRNDLERRQTDNSPRTFRHLADSLHNRVDSLVHYGSSSASASMLKTAGLALLVGGLLTGAVILLGEAAARNNPNSPLFLKPTATLSGSVKEKLAEIQVTSAARTADIEATMQAITDAQLAEKANLTPTLPYAPVYVESIATLSPDELISPQFDGLGGR